MMSNTIIRNTILMLLNNSPGSFLLADRPALILSIRCIIIVRKFENMARRKFIVPRDLDFLTSADSLSHYKKAT